MKRTRGNADTLSEKEKKVYDYIKENGPVTIAQIAGNCFSDLTPFQANSWTRNQLRKLRDKLKLITKTARGTYIIIDATAQALAPSPEVEIPVCLDAERAKAVIADEIVDAVASNLIMFVPLQAKEEEEHEESSIIEDDGGEDEPAADVTKMVESNYALRQECDLINSENICTSQVDSSTCEYPQVIHNDICKRNPRALTSIEIENINPETVAGVRHLDCAMYNDCLAQCVKDGWAGFGCSECSSYEELDPESKYSDLLNMAALRMAVTLSEEGNGTGRKRGKQDGSGGRKTENEEEEYDGHS